MAYVKGNKEVKAAMKSVSKKLRASIRKGSRAGCRLILAQAKELAPEKTGALQRAMKVKAIPRSRRFIGTMVRMEVFYGAFVDLGTKHIKARNFMRGAAKDEKMPAINTLCNAIREGFLN